MPHETAQPHYQHHVGSSSQVESFQQQSFRPLGVQSTQLFGYRDQPHMSFQSSFHQPHFNYSTSPSQQQFFIGPSNPFATSTMNPPSAYNPMSSMHYYDQQCLHSCPKIRMMIMKSKALTMTFHLHPLLPFHPNNNHNNDHKNNEEDPHVTQLLINDNFSYISIL